MSDIGTHWMDSASFVLGSQIAEVYAHWKPSTKAQTADRRGPDLCQGSADQKYETYPVQTEDYAAVLLRWENGVFGSLNVSQVAAGRKNCLRLEVYGSEDRPRGIPRSPTRFITGVATAPTQSLFADPQVSCEDIAGFSDYPGGHAEGFPDTFKMNCRAIYSAIATGSTKAPSSRQSPMDTTR